MIEFADQFHIDNIGILRTNVNYIKTRTLSHVTEQIMGMHTGKYPWSKRRRAFLLDIKNRTKYDPDLAGNILVWYHYNTTEKTN